MIYELSPKCDFSEIEPFKEKIYRNIYAPLAAVEAWDGLAWHAFHSGYPEGMLPVTCGIERAGSMEAALLDETLCRRLVCCQRGVLSICAVLGDCAPPATTAKLLADFPALFPALFGADREKDSMQLGRAFMEWKGLADTVNVWIVWHGGDSRTIREKVSSRCLRKLHELERQYGGAGFGCAVAGFAAIAYKVLLERVFWPAWHLHEKVNAAVRMAERRHARTGDPVTVSISDKDAATGAIFAAALGGEVIEKDTPAPAYADAGFSAKISIQK